MYEKTSIIEFAIFGMNKLNYGFYRSFAIDLINIAND